MANKGAPSPVIEGNATVSDKKGDKNPLHECESCPSSANIYKMVQHALKGARTLSNQGPTDAPLQVSVGLGGNEYEMANPAGRTWEQMRAHTGLMARDSKSEHFSGDEIFQSLKAWLIDSKQCAKIGDIVADDSTSPEGTAAHLGQLTTLRAAFENGIWNQHLRDQDSKAAAVKGVRFFYAPAASSPQSSSVDERLLSPTIPDKISEGALFNAQGGKYLTALGHSGYITILPEISYADPDTNDFKYSLAKMKDWLQRSKAWEGNRKSFGALVGKIVPVIYMARGRPKDKRFSGNDALLGMFMVVEEDADVLSCTLSPRPWPWENSADLTCTSVKHISSAFAKKRRKELPVYTPTGSLMGRAGLFASTGAACKDIWITYIQNAKASIRVNAYCISDPDILEELRKAAAPSRGVVVRIRYDARQQSKTQQGIFEEERMRHVSVHPVEVSADERVIMHKKELMIDCEASGIENGRRAFAEKPSAFLVLGSYNPTQNAKGNQESVAVLTHAETLGACAARFDQDWGQETWNYEREISKDSVPEVEVS